MGENTGQLDTAFMQIKIYLEAECQTHRRIKAALRYPSMVVIAIILAIGIINVVVIPSFRNFFASFGAKLPLPTQILISCSDLIVNHGWLLISLAMIISVSAFVFLHYPNGKWWWSYFKLKIPFIGDILKRAIYARFCRAFAMSVKANVPLLQAFKIVSKVVDNPYLAGKILLMRQSVERGETLFVAAKNTDMFSPLVLQMLMVGEETGEIENVLMEVADYYEQDVDYDLKRLNDAIEPLLIIIIAAMVLVLALGVFLPMWDISSVAFKKIEGV